MFKRLQAMQYYVMLKEEQASFSLELASEVWELGSGTDRQ